MIHPTAIIYEGVTIEEDVYIGPYCIIGAPAEHKKYWGKPNINSVIIKKGSIIHGHATIDAGTVRDTIVGEDSFIMKAVHIGHDAILKPGCILAPKSVVGGHVVLHENVNMGIGSIIHQRCEIPKGCMIGMGSVITKATKLEEFGCYIGVPARYLRENRR